MARANRRKSGAVGGAGRGGRGGGSRGGGRMASRRRNASAGAMGTLAIGVIMVMAGIILTMASSHTDAQGHSQGTIYIGLIVVGAFTAIGGLAGTARGKG